MCFHVRVMEIHGKPRRIFSRNVYRPRYRGGPEIRPVAGAGATPQLHYEGLKRGRNGEAPSLNMVYQN